MTSVALAVSQALPIPATARTGELTELHDELDRVAHQALAARAQGLGLAEAVRNPAFPELTAFHRALADALFVELPEPLCRWFDGAQEPESSAGRHFAMNQFTTLLTQAAAATDKADGLQAALAELLLFEALCLRLYIAAWSSEDFERLGGEMEDLERIAWTELQATLATPHLHTTGVRPLQVMFAGACVSLLHDSHRRAEALQLVGDDMRDELQTRARLRSALRELRLPEAVLLENALANLLGQERVELTELQSAHPVALAGLSRQAMDQRVSRGRKALGAGPQHWPRRRGPALFDRLRHRIH